MKLSHLSLAIFSAIALAACGGSSGDQTTPDPKPDPKPEPKDPVKDESKIVDPAQTGVVGNLDFSTESSVGTTQYIRGKKSKFDRVDNPNEATSATSIFGVSVNQQNPYLTNIALARLKDPRSPKQTIIQYLGNSENNPSDLVDIHSLQQQNKHNVKIGYDLTSAGDVITKTDAENQLVIVDKLIEQYEKEDKLNAVQQSQLKVLQTVSEELNQIVDRFDENASYGQNRLILKKDGTYIWGDGIKTSQNVLNLDSTSVKATASATSGPIAIGLVGINYDNKSAEAPAEFANARVRGLEKNSRSSTRIFGYNNLAVDATNNTQVAAWNTYSGATTVVPNGGETSYMDMAAPGDFTKAQKSYTDASTAVPPVNKLKWELAAIPDALEYVQYGRVTGDLDPPRKLSKTEMESGEEFIYRPADYLRHGDAKAVDTYFYRGPNATTIAQMEKVAAGGQVLTYNGHALMYGIDNEFHNKTPNSVPTAFGKTSKHGIGNFVSATVDLEKGRLDNGFVYNVWQQDNDQATVKDALVRFDGNIYGNTVIGEAQRTYNTSDKADFRASFFGPAAEELGGAFNSTTWQERYGAKGDAWGGVFGAKRVPDEGGLSNQQLGDIPPLTQPKAAEETPEG